MPRPTDRPFIDISQTLRADMPSWPGDTRFDAHPTWRHGPDCPVAVARYTASTHTGTHADAPLHYDPSGLAIDAVSLAPFVGPARVVDLRGGRPVVSPGQLAPFLAGQSVPPRILIRTYDRFPHERWASGFVTVAADAVALLAARGVMLLGIDSPSIDPADAKRLRAHGAARDADMRLLEGLVLDDVEAGDYELIALPIRLGGLDAAPVRAVLRPLGAAPA